MENVFLSLSPGTLFACLLVTSHTVDLPSQYYYALYLFFWIKKNLNLKVSLQVFESTVRHPRKYYTVTGEHQKQSNKGQTRQDLQSPQTLPLKPRVDGVGQAPPVETANTGIVIIGRMDVESRYGNEQSTSSIKVGSRCWRHILGDCAPKRQGWQG